MTGAATLDKKLSTLAHFVTSQPGNPYSTDDVMSAALSYYQKLKAADSYTPGASFNQPLLLIKATQSAAAAIDEDYGLKAVCGAELVVTSSTGNHKDFLTNESSPEVGVAINEWFIF